MYSIERKAEIISLLEREGTVDVAGLAKQFNISKETTRRDLRELEREGALRRTHGGAVLESRDTRTGEYPVAIRDIQRRREKLEICRKAAEYISDGDVVFIDNSSTTHYLAQFIPAGSRVTILTNSINLLLAAAKQDCENHTYISLGGLFKGRNLSLYGNITIGNARNFYPDKIFISCAGVSLEENVITDGSIDEVDAKKMMMRHANSVFLLADYTKWSSRGSVYLASPDELNAVVTDARSRDTDLSALKAKEIRIEFA
jgi:DeoR family fructose operon transcriptional repressor